MKRSMASSFALLAILVLCAEAQANPGGINHRQAHQQKLIYQGVNSGSLTKQEVNKLEKQQYNFAQQEARFRASGKGLSKKEIAVLQSEQKALGQNIHEQKHDDQSRNAFHPGNSLYDINKTQASQQQRIYNGIQSGQLTPQEAARLQNQQAAFSAREAQMRASENGLTVKERVRLDLMQDRISDNIHDQKHDGKAR